ncbi:MAG TPA: replication-relaxation family protein [Pseudolabrys sp.]
MDTQTAFKARAKRLVRPENPEPTGTPERALRLLAAVAQNRFCSTPQLAAVDGGSEQNVSRWLKALFHNGFLDRRRVSLTGPLAYAITRKGARLLRERGHLINASVDWTEKNKRAGEKFIEHTLEIAGFMTRLERACEARDDIELLREHEIIAGSPDKTQRAREPLRWRVERIEWGKKEISTVVPDGAFALVFLDDTASYFLLEVDRGTIPLNRTDTEGSAAWRKNIRYKLVTYYDGWKVGRQIEQFGIKQLRVLMLTTSAKRVENMLGVLDEITEGRGSNFFLFGHNGQLKGSDPLNMEWVSGKRKLVRLTD